MLINPVYSRDDCKTIYSLSLTAFSERGLKKAAGDLCTTLSHKKDKEIKTPTLAPEGRWDAHSADQYVKTFMHTTHVFVIKIP